MDVTTQQIGDVTVVLLPEMTLDGQSGKQFRRDIRPVLEGTKKVVFDLSQVRFVDSDGLGAILSCVRAQTIAGGDLKLCCATKPVRIFFDLIRLGLIVGIFDTREAAVRAFAAK